LIRERVTLMWLAGETGIVFAVNWHS